MQQLFFADIFFLITTISVILVAASATAVLIYCALIVHDIRRITRAVRKESVELMENISSLRHYVFSEKHRLFDLAFFASDIIREFITPQSRSAKKRKSASRKKASSRKKKSSVTVTSKE